MPHLAHLFTRTFILFGEVTLKTFKRSEDGIFLLPANNDFQPIPVTNDDSQF